MPGPGGGSHGGGFGGGSHGGGFSGGSRGGGYGRRGYYGGFGFFPFGFGFGRGLFALLLFPIVMLLLLGFVLISSLGSTIAAIRDGGVVEYNEAKFQEYADAQYQAEFGSLTDSYEDNVLVVITTNEECDGYYCIAWVGNHLHPNVSDLFGDEYTALGKIVQNSINDTYYKNSMTSNLVRIAVNLDSRVQSAIPAKGVFLCKDVRAPYASHLTNHSKDVEIDAELVDSALQDFTDDTGIPIVIVVASEEDAFGRTFPVGTLITAILFLAVLGFVIYVIIRSVREKKKKKTTNGWDDAQRKNGYSNEGEFHW